MTPRQTAVLFITRPENRNLEKTLFLDSISQHPNVTDIATMAHDFLLLVRRKQPDLLENWISRAARCSIQPFVSFANGLKNDFEAIKASLTIPISNGPVEGFNNKLKMLKRHMYGRAGLPLLTKRLIFTNLIGTIHPECI